FRVGQIQTGKWHVESMAGHVPESTGSEIPVTAPGESVISVSIRTKWCRAEPKVPAQVWRDRSGCRTCSPLRPDRTVRHHMDFFELSENPAFQQCGRVTQCAVGGSLIPH